MNAAEKHRAPCDLNCLPLVVNMAPLNGGVKAECPFCSKTLTLQTLRYNHKCDAKPGRPRITEEALKAKAMTALTERLAPRQTPEETGAAVSVRMDTLGG